MYIQRRRADRKSFFFQFYLTDNLIVLKGNGLTQSLLLYLLLKI